MSLSMITADEYADFLQASADRLRAGAERIAEGCRGTPPRYVIDDIEQAAELRFVAARIRARLTLPPIWAASVREKTGEIW